MVFLQVADGTECRPYSSSVCVKGKCVRTGCDGIIGSKLQYDKCGVCGGDGNSCIRVAGNFTKKRLENTHRWSIVFNQTLTNGDVIKRRFCQVYITSGYKYLPRLW